MSLGVCSVSRVVVVGGLGGLLAALLVKGLLGRCVVTLVDLFFLSKELGLLVRLLLCNIRLPSVCSCHSCCIWMVFLVSLLVGFCCCEWWDGSVCVELVLFMGWMWLLLGLRFPGHWGQLHVLRGFLLSCLGFRWSFWSFVRWFSMILLGCTEVSLIMHLCFSDCLLNFSFIVWVRMTLPMCLSFDVCVWVRNSSLHNKNFTFYLNRLWALAFICRHLLNKLYCIYLLSKASINIHQLIPDQPPSGPPSSIPTIVIIAKQPN